MLIIKRILFKVVLRTRYVIRSCGWIAREFGRTQVVKLFKKFSPWLVFRDKSLNFGIITHFFMLLKIENCVVSFLLVLCSHWLIKIVTIAFWVRCLSEVNIMFRSPAECPLYIAVCDIDAGLCLARHFSWWVIITVLPSLKIEKISHVFNIILKCELLFFIVIIQKRRWGWDWLRFHHRGLLQLRDPT